MLTERESDILRTVIDLYVWEGVPVSSNKVKESSRLGVSTATIRNIMAVLEQAGLLSKPHTSAGRIPTDDGYRFYVDTLGESPPHFAEFSQRLREELREQARDINMIMAATSRLLGNLSKNFAVVYGAVMQESTVGRVQLVQLEGTRLLVVVALSPEYERTTVIRMDKRYDHEVVARSENWINRVVGGKSLGDAKDALDSALRDNVTEEGILSREIAVHRENIFSEPPAVELYFEDRGHLLQQPELSDPKLLQMLLRLLHNKGYLTSILSERLDERTQITIGSENKDEQLRSFSLVTAGYRMGSARGALGIIGPTRMRYDVALFLVDAAARELQAIGEEYF